MMKTLSLLKAVLTEDMNMFRYQVGANASTRKKILLPIFLFLVVCVCIGFYAYMIGSTLYEVNLTYVMLTLFIFMVSSITIIEGIYKSQGILFEARDNELLLSLPIKKSQILFVRLFKLLLFQYLYNLMFLLPAFVMYIYFEHPGVGFYLISFVMLLLIPIIPMVISSILGYLIKMIVSKFKMKRVVQTMLSSIIFVLIFLLSFKANNFIQELAGKALSINDMITKMYYPVGAYISLINKFDIVVFIKLLLINIIPLILFVLIGGKYYFKIIVNSKDSITRKSKIKKEVFKKNSPIKALIKKELKRYFSSPVYMLNTIFGLFLVLIVTILLCIKGESGVVKLLSSEELGGINISIPVMYYICVLFSCLMTSITSSCISLEGKTINITRSLPISEKDILKSKIIYPYIIELPFIVLAELIFFVVFNLNIIEMVLIMGMSIGTITLSSILGLIINLKYPKMNASSDTEIVKQSMSSMVAIFINIGILVIMVSMIATLYDMMNIYLLLGIQVFVIIILDIILYYILMNDGIKEYRSINV